MFQQDIDLIKKDFQARAVSVASIFKFPTLELRKQIIFSTFTMFILFCDIAQGCGEPTQNVPEKTQAKYHSQ